MEQFTQIAGTYLPPINTAALIIYAVYSTQQINELKNQINFLEKRLSALEGMQKSTTNQLTGIKSNLRTMEDNDRISSRSGRPTPTTPSKHSRPSSQKTPRRQIDHLENNDRRNIHRNHQSRPQSKPVKNNTTHDPSDYINGDDNISSDDARQSDLDRSEVEGTDALQTMYERSRQ